MLSEPTRQAILDLQKSYPQPRSALIPALHLAQAEVGYLPPAVQAEVAALFALDPNEVEAIVTFYDMFFEAPTGKHVLHVCKNVSCMLRGSDELIDTLCQHLAIKPGGTTADGQFTVIPCECLGACDRAPMLLADDRVVGPVELRDIQKVLDETRQGPGHPSPMPPVEPSHA